MKMQTSAGFLKTNLRIYMLEIKNVVKLETIIL